VGGKPMAIHLLIIPVFTCIFTMFNEITPKNAGQKWENLWNLPNLPLRLVQYATWIGRRLTPKKFRF